MGFGTAPQRLIHRTSWRKNSQKVEVSNRLEGLICPRQHMRYNVLRVLLRYGAVKEKGDENRVVGGGVRGDTRSGDPLGADPRGRRQRRGGRHRSVPTDRDPLEDYPCAKSGRRNCGPSAGESGGAR